MPQPFDASKAGVGFEIRVWGLRSHHELSFVRGPQNKHPAAESPDSNLICPSSGRSIARSCRRGASEVHLTL